MSGKTLKTIAVAAVALAVALGAAWKTHAQAAMTTYPSMAPAEQYMMERDAEIALAKSAAPDSIAKDAEVMVMGHHGYETAVKGKNGFVCIVERGWTAPIDDPNFWNPKLHGPICLNPAAARTYLPLTLKKTEMVLAGKSKAEMFEGIKNGLDKKELPAIEPGAMSYMLSKDGYLGDGNGHWHPHLMFWVPMSDGAAWGANMPGSPLISSQDPEDRLTVFFLPLPKWSDGTAYMDGH